MPVPAFRSAHHARLASGCWLGSTVWACLPTGFLRKVSVMFSYIAFSFPKLSWRRRCPLISSDVRLHLWRRYFPLHMDQQRGNAQHETANDLPIGILQFVLRSLL